MRLKINTQFDVDIFKNDKLSRSSCQSMRQFEIETLRSAEINMALS
jgi:hypothetical protein